MAYDMTVWLKDHCKENGMVQSSIRTQKEFNYIENQTSEKWSGKRMIIWNTLKK